MPILINRLPKDLIERIKREGIGIFVPKHGYEYIPKFGCIYSHRLEIYFDAKTGKKLSSAQVMNRTKRKGVASTQ